MKEQYYVYWYRTPEHTNPYREGYIGITNDILRRDKEHRRSKLNTHFSNALKKYTHISYSILHIVSKEEALALEYEYRPNLNIGWNYAVGGEDTLSSFTKKPITLYHKDTYVITVTYDSIKEAANAIGVTEGSLRQKIHRKSSSYNKEGWAILFDTNFDRSTTLTEEEAKSASLTGIKRSKPSHFKGKQRWTEVDKKRIGEQHKGKSISEEQKRIVSKKNRENSPLCKTIHLVHKDDVSKVHKFHSISEASRQLGIPLSRLKSKAQRPINRFGKDGWAITYLGS